MSDELPKIGALLVINDKTVGDIVINPDGSFEGRISDRLTHVLWVSYLRDGFSDSMLLQPNVFPAIKEGQPVARNVFENNADNTVEVPLVELTRLGDKLYTILPLLEDGSRYQLDTLSNGRVAVVIEKG